MMVYDGLWYVDDLPGNLESLDVLFGEPSHSFFQVIQDRPDGMAIGVTSHRRLKLGIRDGGKRYYYYFHIH